MFSTNLAHLCIAELMSAVTFSLKDVAEPSLLNISIPKTEKKGKIYSKIEGKGKAHYHYIDAITAVLSGFIYAINPYLPLILSIVISGFACLVSLLFEEIEEEDDDVKIIGVKEQLTNLKDSFKYIFKSKRLKSLMIYSGITWGFMCLMSEYRESILKDLGASSQIMGTMSAIFGIVAGIASKKQVQFHNKFRNRSLAVITISCSIVMIITGLIAISGIPFWPAVILIILLGIIGKSDGAMNNILVDRYLGNFTNKEIISKIYAANSMARNLMRMLIGMLGSWLIGITTSANAMLFVGCVFLVISIVLVIYMKPRVGLKPEEYKKEEIGLEV